MTFGLDFRGIDVRFGAGNMSIFLSNKIPNRLWPPTQLATKLVDCVWNVMAHANKPNFVFRRNGRVHLNRQGRQFSRLLAAELCASAVVTLDTPSSEVVWRVLAVHFISQFPLHFPSRASPCAITFQLDSTTTWATVACGWTFAFIQFRRLECVELYRYFCIHHRAVLLNYTGEISFHHCCLYIEYASLTWLLRLFQVYSYSCCSVQTWHALWHVDVRGNWQRRVNLWGGCCLWL